MIVPMMCLLLGYGSETFGQSKFESETRIKSSEVPASALSFMQPKDSNFRMRWYQEASQLGTSYEAKTRIRRSWYSVEFDSTGQLLDIEKRISSREVSDELSEKIRKAFEPLFSRYKILKIQEQYLTGAPDFRTFLLSDTPFDHLECSVRGERQGIVGDFEILITTGGEIVEILENVGRSSDNLEF